MGDRGALALCEGLRSHSSVKVLELARCDIKDLGGCGVAAALVMNRSLQEVDLGWNALSHEAARSLAVALR
jgi:Ran GTPase-activating protein (RanGAP) involved in mRNA processing and transport